LEIGPTLPACPAQSLITPESVYTAWRTRVEGDVRQRGSFKPALSERALPFLKSLFSDSLALAQALPLPNFALFTLEETLHEIYSLRDVLLDTLKRNGNVPFEYLARIENAFHSEVQVLSRSAFELRRNRQNQKSLDSRRLDEFDLAQDMPLAGAVAFSFTELTTIALPPERMRALAEASKLLLESVDYEKTMDRIARLSLRTMADWCIVDIINEDHTFDRFAVLHRDAGKHELTEELRRDFKPAFNARGVASHVLRTGQAILVPRVDDDHYRATSRSPRHEQILRALGSTTYICAPLMARGNFLGAMMFVSSDPARSYDEQDTRFARELCACAALALDNALLFRKKQRAVRLREDVIGMVSHDLKNPLHAISLSTSLLKQLSGAGKNLPEIADKALNNIQNATRRMSRLIGDLLDLSKIESGKMQMLLQKTSLSSIFGEMTESFEAIAREKFIHLVMKAEGEASESVIFACDHDRLLQALSNLMDNAIKFTPPEGEVHLSGGEKDDTIWFKVKDTGPGIRQEDIPRLFDRFWQAENSDHHGGSGLGLYIVKAMIDAHGGSVEVTSEPGQGTCFKIILPKTGKSEEI
jgi:signal transduction histidine kinase